MRYRVVIALAALALFVVFAACRPAVAETVHGYVYVTGASSVRLTYKSQPHECRVTLQLPARPVAQPPANDDRSPLANATSIKVTVSDPFDNCTHYIHTWQPATFDPADPDHPDIDWPAGRPSIIDILLYATVAILTGRYALGRIRARWARTHRTVQDT